jgi:hypothetical protein
VWLLIVRPDDRCAIAGVEDRFAIPWSGRSLSDRPRPVPSRSGGDLLFRGLSRSTIGAEGFHGRVRDGIGCWPLAMATRPARDSA